MTNPRCCAFGYAKGFLTESTLGTTIAILTLYSAYGTDSEKKRNAAMAVALILLAFWIFVLVTDFFLGMEWFP